MAAILNCRFEAYDVAAKSLEHLRTLNAIFSDSADKNIIISSIQGDKVPSPFSIEKSPGVQQCLILR